MPGLTSIVIHSPRIIVEAQALEWNLWVQILAQLQTDYIPIGEDFLLRKIRIQKRCTEQPLYVIACSIKSNFGFPSEAAGDKNLSSIYLLGKYRNNIRGVGKWHRQGKAAYKKYITKPATAVDNWSLITQGNTGK